MKKKLKTLLTAITIFAFVVMSLPIAPEVSADTTTKTFVYASTVESFAFTSGGKSTGVFDGTNGNAAGSINHDSTGRNNLDTSYWEWTGTWESLGVPAGSTVTQIRVNGTDTRVFNWNVVDSVTIGPYEIWDNEAVPVIMATLWAGRSPTGTEGTWTSTGAQSDQNVSATYQASGSTIRLRLYGTVDNGNNAAAQATFNHDNVSFVITYTVASATFTQNNFAWYVNPGTPSENVTDLWGNPDITENNIITPVPPSNDPPDTTQELRLRMSITVNTAVIGANERWFKLQFRTGTDSDCSTGSWTDVGAAAGGEAFVYTSDATVSDDAALSASKLTGTDVKETYSRVKPANTPIGTGTPGEDIEFDFHFLGTNSASAERYLFRIYEANSDGTDLAALNTYSNCPILHTEPGIESQMRHGNIFSGNLEQGFFWTD